MDRGRVRFGSLGGRLFAAFLLVAVVPVVLVAAVAGVSVNRSTAALIEDQRTQLRTQVAAALAAAYSSGRGSWQNSPLSVVQYIADTHGVDVVVTDNTGHQVATAGPGHHVDAHGPEGTSTQQPSGMTPTPSHDGATAHPASIEPSPGPTHQDHPQSASPMHSETHASQPDEGDSHSMALPAVIATPRIELMATSSPVPATAPTSTMTIPVVVGGKQVGTATLTLPAAADAAVDSERTALLTTITMATLVAVLLAALAALLVSRRVSRPLVALAAATRSFAAGDPNPERLIRPAPGELGEVGGAFVAMAAALRREDELRRAVTADVAHELRTPVTILRGQTEQLLDGIAEPTTARLVSIHDEVLRLERVTDDLATLSAADAAGLSLQTGPVDIASVVTQAMDAMGPQFTDAEIAATCDVTGPVIVDGDATRLTQVVTNLLTNAVKFTPAGGTIGVRVHSSGSDALLTVTDSGPGIPTADLPHIFDRFWRGSAARTRHGTGIGLSVVQTLVTAHGGSVTADSAQDGGARFDVRIPLKRATGS